MPKKIGPESSRDRVLEELRKGGACDEALDWIKKTFNPSDRFKDIWAECTRFDWMTWYLECFCKVAPQERVVNPNYLQDPFTALFHSWVKLNCRYMSSKRRRQRVDEGACEMLRALFPKPPAGTRSTRG